MDLVFAAVFYSAAVANGSINADDDTDLIVNGSLVYEDDSVVVRTTFYYSPDDFVGVGPFNFNDVEIIGLQPLFVTEGEMDYNNGRLYQTMFILIY